MYFSDVSLNIDLAETAQWQWELLRPRPFCPSLVQCWSLIAQRVVWFYDKTPEKQAIERSENLVNIGKLQNKPSGTMKELHCAKPQRLSWLRKSCNESGWKVANLATVGFSLQLFAPVATWSQMRGLSTCSSLKGFEFQLLSFSGMLGRRLIVILKASLLFLERS